MFACQVCALAAEADIAADCRHLRASCLLSTGMACRLPQFGQQHAGTLWIAGTPPGSCCVYDMTASWLSARSAVSGGVIGDACIGAYPKVSIAVHNNMLSNRRETDLQGGLAMAKSGRLELGDNIYGYYKFIFNHCDAFGQQSNRSPQRAFQ